jgi:DNA-directed RNA polymerase specialized sigma24 family protein
MQSLNRSKPNYSRGEIKWLVEDYDNLRGIKGVDSDGRKLLLCKLSDLHTGLSRLSLKEYTAVLLCGMLEISTRTAGSLVGVSAVTMNNRYRHGLQSLYRILNGGR